MNKIKQFWSKNGEAIQVITMLLAVAVPITSVCLISIHNYNKKANKIINDLNDETNRFLEDEA